jgi:hypothetical protein
MYKILSLIPMFLLSIAAYAAKEPDAPSAPVETVGTIYIVIFGILFIGMIVGFFVYLWMSDDKEPKDK